MCCCADSLPMHAPHFCDLVIVSDEFVRFGWDVGEEDDAIPQEGSRAGGSSGATEPSSRRKHALLHD